MHQKPQLRTRSKSKVSFSVTVVPSQSQLGDHDDDEAERSLVLDPLEITLNEHHHHHGYDEAQEEKEKEEEEEEDRTSDFTPSEVIRLKANILPNVVNFNGPFPLDGPLQRSVWTHKFTDTPSSYQKQANNESSLRGSNADRDRQPTPLTLSRPGSAQSRISLTSAHPWELASSVTSTYTDSNYAPPKPKTVRRKTFSSPILLAKQRPISATPSFNLVKSRYLESKVNPCLNYSIHLEERKRPNSTNGMILKNGNFLRFEPNPNEVFPPPPQPKPLRAQSGRPTSSQQKASVVSTVEIGKDLLDCLIIKDSIKLARPTTSSSTTSSRISKSIFNVDLAGRECEDWATPYNLYSAVANKKDLISHRRSTVPYLKDRVIGGALEGSTIGYMEIFDKLDDRRAVDLVL